METINKSNPSQNLGIAAIITALITFVIAVIPCVGLVAIIPGIVTIILGVIGITQASRTNSPNGLSLAGLIIAVIACMISVSQIFVAGRLARKISKGDFSYEMRELREELRKEFRSERIRGPRRDFRRDRIMEEIEIPTPKINEEQARTLEKLEKPLPPTDDTLQTK